MTQYNNFDMLYGKTLQQGDEVRFDIGETSLIYLIEENGLQVLFGDEEEFFRAINTNKEDFFGIRHLFPFPTDIENFPYFEGYNDITTAILDLFNCVELKNREINERMTEKMLLGVEIECILNEDLCSEIPRGSYHNGVPFLDNWNVESDGSLCSSGNFDRERTVEFVSKGMNIENYEEVINQFKDYFKQKGELNKSMYFNKTCGCHIHFGFSRKEIYKKIDLVQLIKLRNYFFLLLKKSNLPEEIKEGIKNHYYRNYSKKTTFKNYDYSIRHSNTRYLEFNKNSEIDKKGFEWRSFNILDISTWEQFDEMFKIVKECWKFIENSLKGYKVNKKYILSKKIDRFIFDISKEYIYINTEKEKIVPIETGKLEGEIVYV